MSLGLPAHVDRLIHEIAQEDKVTKVLVVRRAVSVYAKIRKVVREDTWDVARLDGALVRQILLEL